MNLFKVTTFFIVVIAIIALLIGIIIFLLQGKNPSNYLNLNQAAVVKEMQSLNRYETAVFTIEKIIDAGTSGNVFQQFLFGDKILLIAHGQVIAGFDFAKIKSSDIDVNQKSLYIHLPPPEILLTTLDNAQTKVYDRKRGILNQDNRDLESEARKAAEKSITKAACDEGILNQASDNARKQLSTLFSTAGFTQVSFDIPPGVCPN